MSVSCKMVQWFQRNMLFNIFYPYVSMLFCVPRWRLSWSKTCKLYKEFLSDHSVQFRFNQKCTFLEKALVHYPIRSCVKPCRGGYLRILIITINVAFVEGNPMRILERFLFKWFRDSKEIDF